MKFSEYPEPVRSAYLAYAQAAQQVKTGRFSQARHRAKEVARLDFEVICATNGVNPTRLASAYAQEVRK